MKRVIGGGRSQRAVLFFPLLFTDPHENTHTHTRSQFHIQTVQCFHPVLFPPGPLALAKLIAIAVGNAQHRA